jgi:hypothetical protein
VKQILLHMLGEIRGRPSVIIYATSPAAAEAVMRPAGMEWSSRA